MSFPAPGWLHGVLTHDEIRSLLLLTRPGAVVPGGNEAADMRWADARRADGSGGSNKAAAAEGSNEGCGTRDGTFVLSACGDVRRGGAARVRRVRCSSGAAVRNRASVPWARCTPHTRHTPHTHTNALPPRTHVAARLPAPRKTARRAPRLTFDLRRRFCFLTRAGQHKVGVYTLGVSAPHGRVLFHILACGGPAAAWTINGAALPNLTADNTSLTEVMCKLRVPSGGWDVPLTDYISVAASTANPVPPWLHPNVS